MQIFRMRQGVCCCRFCPQRLPISHQWMPATNQNLDSSRCKAKNRWCSVDAHAQNGAVTVLLSLLLITAANWSILPNSNQINYQIPYLQHQKLLTLCRHSFLEWGIDCVAVSFLLKSCQYIIYPKKWPYHYSFTILVSPKIIDAPLTLILRYCPSNIWCHR